MDIAPRILSGEAIVEEARKEDSGVLWSVLVVHTFKRLKYRYGRRGTVAELKEESRERLSEALDLIFVAQTRNWNTERYQSFVEFAISVIDSHLSNYFGKARNKEITVDNLPDTKLEDSIEDKALYIETRKKAFKILQSLGAQDDELIVFECMADGIAKPIEIRGELGIAENEFRNIWRRLGPRLEQLRNQMKDE